MTDLLLPQQGARPWLPADNVLARQTLDLYNIPLAGLIEQDGKRYVFACLVGEIEPLNVWAYAHVTDDEVNRLLSLVDDDLAVAIDQVLTNRMLVVAMASDHELVDWLRIDAGMEGALGLAKRFVAQMRRRVENVGRDVDGLASQRELASC
jgi:hypothetical protein